MPDVYANTKPIDDTPTLRDQFAMAALAMTAHRGCKEIMADAEHYAQAAYVIADYMMKIRQA